MPAKLYRAAGIGPTLRILDLYILPSIVLVAAYNAGSRSFSAKIVMRNSRPNKNALNHKSIEKCGELVKRIEW